MMLVAFRARRTPEGDGNEYKKHHARMTELATRMPGSISHTGYVARDGERLSLFEWKSAETLRAWATHPEHVPVKRIAPERFCTQDHLPVCAVVREFEFRRPD